MRLSQQSLTAFLLLLGMIVLTRHYAGGEESPSREDLNRFPPVIGLHWLGTDEPLDSEAMAVLNADDVLMRRYERYDKSLLWMFVSYYRSQRTGRTYHSPMNCLPGGGWTIVERQEVPLSIGQQALAVNRVLIKKGLSQQLIVYWYQDRGRMITSEYLAKAYLLWDAMVRRRTDGALVRISVPITDTPDHAFEVAMEFMRAAVPLLGRHLPA